MFIMHVRIAHFVYGNSDENNRKYKIEIDLT